MRIIKSIVICFLVATLSYSDCIGIFTPAALAFEAVEESADIEAGSSRIYRNPAERREAGLATEIMEGVTFSGLVELEKIKTRNHFKENVNEQEDDPTTTTLQLAFKAEYQDWLEAEVVFETEYSRHLHDNSSNYHSSTHSYIDEATISIDLDKVGIQFGRINLPFGEYNSYFITGPMLEFGETRRDAIMADYTFLEKYELTVFGLNSKTEKVNSKNSNDWGASIEYKSDDESVQTGVSYISDLSESDEQFLRDFNNQYTIQVPAWSAYLLVGYDEFEVSLETVQALKDFVELDTQSNKPSATNLEIAYFMSEEWIFAARLAQSKELEDAPELQYGISISLLTKSIFIFSFDYLYGDFKKGFVVNDDDVALRHQHQVAFRLSLEL